MIHKHKKAPADGFRYRFHIGGSHFHVAGLSPKGRCDVYGAGRIAGGKVKAYIFRCFGEHHRNIRARAVLLTDREAQGSGRPFKQIYIHQTVYFRRDDNVEWDALEAHHFDELIVFRGAGYTGKVQGIGVPVIRFAGNGQYKMGDRYIIIR